MPKFNLLKRCVIPSIRWCISQYRWWKNVHLTSLLSGCTTLCILVQHKLDGEAATRYFKNLRKTTTTSRKIITDKLKSYICTCKSLLTQAIHVRDKGCNNREKNSHQPTRFKEAKMLRFKSIHQVQWFLSNFATIYDFFRDDPRQLTASNHHLLHARSLEFWLHIALNPSALT